MLVCWVASSSSACNLGEGWAVCRPAQAHENAPCPSHNAPHHRRVKGSSRQLWLAPVLRPSGAHLNGCSAWVCAQVVSSSAACNLGEGLTVHRPVQGNESAHCPSHNAPHHWRVKGSSGFPSASSQLPPAFLSAAFRPPLSFLPASSRLPLSFLSPSSRLPLAFLSASSQLPPSFLSPSSRLPPSFLSASSRLPLGLHSTSSHLPPSFLPASSQLRLSFPFSSRKTQRTSPCLL